METIRNTYITDVDVIIEDHGILTLAVSFDGGGLPLRMTGGPKAPLLGSQIANLLATFGVRELSALKGKPARVRLNGSTWEAVGHFIEDRWYTGETDDA